MYNTYDSEHELISSWFSQNIVFTVYFVVDHHGRRNWQKTKLNIKFPLSTDEAMISESQLPYASMY